MTATRVPSRTSPPYEPATSEAWCTPAETVLQRLGVDADRGLSKDEARRRQALYGPNRIGEAKRRSAWLLFLQQFRSLVVGLLAAATVASLIFGEWLDGGAIAVVILINGLLGFVTELRAVRSMEALRRMGRVSARVRRDGSETQIAAEALVPGDIVPLEGGDVVSADMRLVEASKLQADEATLTGESLPVGKSVVPVAVDTDLAERRSMLFKGTSVTRGSGLGVVVATGAATELGRIGQLIEAMEDETTPLEARLDRLGQALVWITLGIASLTAIAGIVSGRNVLLMIETGIALAVAAIPEGLPIVATIALARGMWRLAQRHALINRLSAVETLGSTSVIFTDKTGTLTENRLTVTCIRGDAGEVFVTGEGMATVGRFTQGEARETVEPPADIRRALEIGVLCNNASVRVEGAGAVAVGDPLEVALLVAGLKAGIVRSDLVGQLPEVQEEPFDPVTRMMATIHRTDGGFLVAVKGAAEAVLEKSTRFRGPHGVRSLSPRERQTWLERNAAMASRGSRVLALAEREAASAHEAPYHDLTMVGLVGMLDPPRAGVREALAACRRAGLRVVMVTGDQPQTAQRIALDVGLVDDPESEVVLGRDLRAPETLSAAERERLLGVSLFSRMDPRHKLDLIALHQERGAAVAMTGDGVNDAPALKKADIGIAMGLRGTEVAREAADMVLKDDAFASIVEAVRGGRIIFGNIRKFVLYLMSCNVSEIMVVTGATLLGAPLPLLPLQLLFLNLVTDVFPALALGFGRGDPGVMSQPPRDPGEALLARRHWEDVAVLGALITAAVIGTLLVSLFALGYDHSRAVTLSFLTLAAAQLWNVFNMRARGSSASRNDVIANPWVWGALGLCILLILAAVYVPGLATVLELVPPDARGWTLVLTTSLAPLVGGQIWLTARGSRGRRARNG